MRSLITALAPAVVLFSSSLCSCGHMPTSAELSTANMSPPPSQSRAEELARGFMQRVLKDPNSAQVEFGSLRRATYKADAFSSWKLAYRMRTKLNAKNSFGGYTGFEQWDFYFYDDQLCAVSRPERIVHDAEPIQMFTTVDGGAPNASSLIGDSGPSKRVADDDPRLIPQKKN